jgi:peptidoglycan/LPS O-acetylase OafA/YrhL
LRLFGVEPYHLQGTYFEFVIYWIIGAVSAGLYSKVTLDIERFYGNLATIVVVSYIFYFALTNFIHIKGFYVFTNLLLAALSGAMLILSLLTERRLKLQNSKFIKYLAVFGARSYSLYVVHTPVIFITLWYFSTHTILMPSSYPLLVMLAVIVSTEFIFRFIEMPSHQYLKT